MFHEDPEPNEVGWLDGTSDATIAAEGAKVAMVVGDAVGAKLWIGQL